MTEVFRVEDGKFQAFDSNGVPLSGGLVYTYEAGTTTPLTTYPTYADAIAGTNANDNPIELDSRGEGKIFCTEALKIVLKTAAGVDIYTVDKLTDLNSVAGNAIFLAQHTAAGAHIGVRFLSEFADFSTAISTISGTATILLLDDDVSLGGDETVPATLEVINLIGSTFTTTGYTLTNNGRWTNRGIITGTGTFANNNFFENFGSVASSGTFTQAASGATFKNSGSLATTVTFTGLKYSQDDWFGAAIDGSTDDGGAIQAAIDALGAGGRFLKVRGSSYSVVNDEIDVDTVNSVIIDFEPGAEIRIETADKDIFNITKDYVQVLNATLEGEGTYVTSGTSGAALIRSSGKYTTIKRSYCKEPEQYGISITGDHSHIEGNIIEGGPYFDSYTDGTYPIGSDRQHFGIHLSGVTGGYVYDNVIIPNNEAETGVVIQGILPAGTSNGVRVIGNWIGNTWDHAIYAGNVDGCAFIGNRCEGSGLKVDMLGWTTERQGNVVVGNTITIDDQDSPLTGDSGIVLANACYTTCTGNTIKLSNDSGIGVSSQSTPYYLIGNNISGNTIISVIEGIGAQARGISIDAPNCVQFSDNVISNNTIKDIGEDTDDVQASIYINISDTDDNVNNVISNNNLNGCTEVGMQLTHLTDSVIIGNIFRDMSSGNIGALSCISSSDLVRCKIMNNHFHATNARHAIDGSMTYCEVAFNTVYDPDESAFDADFSNTNYFHDNNNGKGDVQTYTTASDRTITADEMWQRTQLRDPNGGNRTDTTPTGTQICNALLPHDGAQHKMWYINTGAETIEIAGGAVVTMFNNEGAGDTVIPAGGRAKLTFIRVSTGTVSCMAEIFEAA